jgi:hypothetical protein
LGKWRIEPSHANTWTFTDDGKITITHPDPSAPPAKGAYSWVSDNTIDIKAADERSDSEKFEEQCVIQSIDESKLVIMKPGQPKSSITFTRVGN